MSAPHVTPLKVRFNELDPYGHVNHSAYVTYFEHGRTEALESIGLPMAEMAERGIQLVVMDIHVSYKVAAVAGDELQVHTWVSSIRRASSRWRQEIRRGDEVCATIEIRAAVTGADGRPTKPPAWLFEAMEPLILPDTDS